MPALPLRLSRWVIGAALLVAGVTAWIYGSTYRLHEARVEAWFVNVLSPVRAVAQDGTAVVWTGMGTSDIMGFAITSACSSAALVGGFCTGTALLLLAWGGRTRAILAGAVLALAVVLITNFVRLSMVIGATRVWGRDGFEWTHHYLGTVLTVLGLFFAAGLYLFVLMRGSGRQLSADRRKAHRA